jgi:DNA-directed RNA polymerase subunit M/transcription elongation factor TFIIS
MNLKDHLDNYKFLLSLLPKWVKEKPRKGMFETHYGTGSYENDMKVYERVQQIDGLLKIEVFEGKCPTCGNEDVTFEERDNDTEYYLCFKCGSCINVYDSGEYNVQTDCVDKD